FSAVFRRLIGIGFLGEDFRAGHFTSDERCRVSASPPVKQLWQPQRGSCGYTCRVARLFSDPFFRR
ncbi:MAG: hypothetical protein MPL62_17720, partial [Alphaproteobacteria bacterium]|nr:hypothetical protein [Alphaproteobacteria bacterium]